MNPSILSQAPGGEAMTQWIKCSERMPDERVFVLLVEAVRSKIYMGYLNRGSWEFGSGLQLESVPVVFRSGDLWKFTHWMPLPAPPAEDE